ncbi:putative nucleotidyltransferase, Ribonuclease H [Helianthus annuus]|nr:putative nucleotidyltransferase, Ribonuclease H [Helianthus annuus]
MPHTRSQGPVKPPIDKSSVSTPIPQVRKPPTSSSALSDSTLPSKLPNFDFTPKSSPHNSPPPSRHPSPPPVHQMAENQTVHQRSTAGFTANSPITLPEITNDKSWQIPSYIMTAINNSCQFHGRDDEDAPAHINRLTRLCSTFGIEGVNLDARYLQVFPFSLAGRAATWLDSQPAGTYTTWAGLRDAFLAKYFPPAKASRLRDQVHSFRMEPDEPYHLAWERFQTLLSRCSQHGLSDWALVEKFYNGLTPECKARFDTSAGGHLMGKKTVADCNDLFESFAHAYIDHSATGRNSNPVITSSSSRGVNQVVSDSKVISQLDYITKELLEIKKKVDRCEVCRGGHDTIDCPTITLEQVEYLAGQNRGPTNPFNNSNSNWRANNYRSSGNPPGFPSGQYQSRGPGFYSSGGSGQTGQFASSGSGGQFRGEGSNQEVQPKSEGSGGSLSRIEDLLSQLLVKDQATQRTLEGHATLLKNNHSSFLDLQRQVGDIARQLQERPPGQFSGNTRPNPSGCLKAISTRSGRTLGEVVRPESVEIEDEDPVDEEIEMEAPGKVQPRLIPESTAHTGGPSSEKSVGKKPVQVVPSPNVDTSRAPFPSRLKNQTYSKEYGKFLEIFKQLRINLPFIEALQSMPKYAKFLKDLLKRKDRLGEVSNIPLSGGCSAVVLNKVPEKLTDPGLFTIPCLFGSDTECRALADLGASINLMPYSLYERLGLGELSPTRMSLSLADRSVKYPRGIIENLLVKVDKFVFPVDFVVLDMEADEKVPIILGRPFLCTAKAIIDVFDGKITLQVGEERVTFEIARSMEHPSGSDDLSSPCHSVYFIESFLSCVDHCFDYISGADIVESRLEEVVEKVEEIVSESKEEGEKGRLLEVLRVNREAIAWRLSDIKGISPAYCTHRILMEDDYKPVVQPQRRLNPNMQEVVKKEVLKLLDAGVIYPISDSPWVSPTQVVPKKGGMTVIMNEKNELIPSRTVTGWRVCIDYRKLNDATRKDHFPLPFIDQMLERLAGQQFYCFLDGFSGYFQIPIAPEDQDKTTFTCPYGTYAYRRMPFGLCNAPATFQRCMVAIFQDMLETSMEVFMDDFSVYGTTFDQCLSNLDRMLKRCIETNLMLNWEKCHFMVTEGIVLGHKVSREGIEVDRAKIDTISRLPPPTSVKSVRSFLGHAGFYRRFIKDFSKITRPMTRLLEKDVPFVFDEECIKAFDFLKEKLVSAPILVSPNWSLPFELMCDASDYAVGAVLGQRVDKHFHLIYYASKTLNDAQENYTTTEKELLAVVFAFDKFRSYLVLSKTTVFTDHSALRFLFQKKDAKSRLIRWILLLSEFDIEIKDKKGAENVAADHLSRLEDPKREEVREDSIGDTFPHETIDFVSAEVEGLPWFSDLANYLATGDLVRGMSYQQKKKLLREARKYIWDDPYLFRIGGDRVLRRCVSKEDGLDILRHVHEGLTGGHHGANVTAQKVFDSGFYWPTVVKDAVEFVRTCDRCQRTGNISSKDEMPQNPIQVLEIFDVWGIDFMGPFPSSSGNRYILVAIDYVSKWVEAQPLPTNDARVVVRFLKKLFTRFGVPKAIISDRGTHFCNSAMEKALARYGVTHRLSTAYHPQTSGQVENANRGVKRILEKTVGKSRKDWSEKLDDALWAFRTAYKTPLGTTPFMIVYGKACHLPVELEHRALWALKTVNLDLTEAARRRFFQIHELEALREAAYERSWSIKEKTKALHDRRLRGLKDFKVGDKVLLFNSRLKLIAGKLKSRWSGPYVVKEVFPYGTVELYDEVDKGVWKVNGHRLKHYLGGPIDTTEEEEIPLEDPPTFAEQ